MIFLDVDSGRSKKKSARTHSGIFFATMVCFCRSISTRAVPDTSCRHGFSFGFVLVMLGNFAPLCMKALAEPCACGVPKTVKRSITSLDPRLRVHTLRTTLLLLPVLNQNHHA